MSINIVDCDINTLTIENILRMVTMCDVDGNFYFSINESEIALSELVDCVECGMDLTVLNILKAALSTNDDGGDHYCLNIVSNE